MHETQSLRMALEEELAMHEATLQTLLRRQQALDVNKARYDINLRVIVVCECVFLLLPSHTTVLLYD